MFWEPLCSHKWWYFAALELSLGSLVSSSSCSSSPPSTSSASSVQPGVHPCLLLLLETGHWNNSDQWCLVELWFWVHQAVSLWHLDPHCFIYLSGHAALEDTSLFHRKLCLLPVMCNQTMFPEGIALVLQPEAGLVLLSTDIAVRTSFSTIAAQPSSPQAGLAGHQISASVLLTIASSATCTDEKRITVRQKRRSSKWFETRDPRKWKVPPVDPFSLPTSSTTFSSLRLCSIDLQQKSISLRALAATVAFRRPPPNDSQSDDGAILNL